jgi:putative cell wall-binding protein
MPRHRLVSVVAAATTAAAACALGAAAPSVAGAPSSAATSPQATSATSATGPVLDRLGGANRYATAVEVSRAVWDDGAAYGKHVYIASGENFPDALAGGPAAASQGEPLLLVPRTGTLPSVVAQEITRLKPSYITIFGGTGAVSSSMATQLKALAGTKDLYREAGADRYETAMRLANYATTWNGSTPTYPKVVYVANGTTFADALSGGAAAALQGAPLLLTPRDRLSQWTEGALAGIRPAKIIVLGGTGAISTTAFNQLKGYAPTVVRIGGVDRFDTSAKVSKATFPVATDATEVFLTNGLTYPDALAATPAVGVLGDVSLLLTRPTCVPAQPFAEANRIQPDYVTAIGGTAAVSTAALGGRAC